MFWFSRRKKTHGATIWLTGLSGAGKTTIAQELVRRLRADGRQAILLDGDILRLGLCSDLGFSQPDRAENVRRTAEVAAILRSEGLYPVVALMSPFNYGRDYARQRSAGRFVEVYVDTPLEICMQRDPKGLYSRQLAGEVRCIPGLDIPYEPPTRPEVVVRTECSPVAASVAQILHAVASLR